MKLSELLAGVPLREALMPELAGLEVAGLDYDSRRVGKGFVFFAFAGSRVDGRQFAQDALAKGALAVVSELPRPVDITVDQGGAWIQVEHGRQALAIAANTFYRSPR